MQELLEHKFYQELCWVSYSSVWKLSDLDMLWYDIYLSAIE